MINLESSEIVEQRRSTDQLREMFDSMDWINGEGAGKSALAATLRRVRAHPGGIDVYCDELYTSYQAGINAHAAAAASARFDEKAVPRPDDPMLALTLPMIGRLARTLNHAATAPVMLQAAIHHRLEVLGASGDSSGPTDPWAEEAGVDFIRETTPDGGFMLRSRYETGPRAPLTYKFAAPDAGFIRTAR